MTTFNIHLSLCPTICSIDLSTQTIWQLELQADAVLGLDPWAMMHELWYNCISTMTIVVWNYTVGIYWERGQECGIVPRVCWPICFGLRDRWMQKGCIGLSLCTSCTAGSVIHPLWSRATGTLVSDYQVAPLLIKPKYVITIFYNKLLQPNDIAKCASSLLAIWATHIFESWDHSCKILGFFTVLIDRLLIQKLAYD